MELGTGNREPGTTQPPVPSSSGPLPTLGFETTTPDARPYAFAGDTAAHHSLPAPRLLNPVPLHTGL